MAEKNKIDVKINGVYYTLLSEESVGYIQETARCVDSKMAEISKSYPRLSTAMVAVLASVNIADELKKAEKKAAFLEEENKRLKSELYKYQNRGYNNK